jgi:hypothetical protein
MPQCTLSTTIKKQKHKQKTHINSCGQARDGVEGGVTKGTEKLGGSSCLSSGTGGSSSGTKVHTSVCAVRTRSVRALKKENFGQMWGAQPVILATQEAEMGDGRMVVLSQPWANV